MSARNALWPQERLARLRSLWLAGLTMAAIAAELGVTKNAVAGMVWRIGLSRKPDPPPRSERVPIPLWFGRDECAWPIGTVGEAGFRFCRAPREEGSPYCAEHHARRARGNAA